MTRSGAVAAILVATLALAACHRERAAIPYKLVGAEAQELRGAFNADADKVRVIMLVSPS